MLRNLGIVIEKYAAEFAAGQVPVRVSVSTAPEIGGAGTPLSSPSYFDASPKTRSKLSRVTIHENAAAFVPETSNKRKRHPKPVKVAVHADMLKVSISSRDRGLKDRTSTGGGIRGTVTGFSRASRKRMIEFMAQIRNPGAMLFLTMTFDDSVLATLDENLDKMFEAFRRRFERKYPNWSALWRMEEIDRKSGDYVGLVVPHYHFIIFTGENHEKSSLEALSQSFLAWGRDAWHEITASTNPDHIVHGFDVSPLRNRKQAYYYTSKYVAKSSDKSVRTGRRWGRIGGFDCSVSQEIRLDEEEYIVFRRLIKRWLKTRAQVPKQNATPEEVEKWLIRDKKQRAYALRFARGSAQTGCTIFGLGDTTSGENIIGPLDGYNRFIAEARRQVADRRERERGYGNWAPTG